MQKNDDLHDTNVVAGIGKSYLMLNKISECKRRKGRSKKLSEEEKQCRLFGHC